MRTLTTIAFLAASTASAAEYTCTLATMSDSGLPIHHETKRGDLEKADLVLTLPEGFVVTVGAVVIENEQYIDVNFQKGEDSSTALFDTRQAHFFQSLKVDGVQAQVQCWLEGT